MRSITILLLISVFAFGIPLANAQNTLGLLSFDQAESLGGYTLIYPNRQSTVYLLDECGQIAHRWDDEQEESVPGPVAYLYPDGRLLRTKVFGPVLTTPSFGAGGSGGIIELVSWDNEVEWTYIVADSTQRQHHDVQLLPNGRLLILAYDRYFLDDIVANGFDTLSYPQRRIWSEKIIEVDPLTDSIHWEWRLWDHLVQDHDSTKLNFGIVADEPGKVNLNYQDFSFLRDDWIHANSLDYNEELDQIMISARNTNEIWIIDHSTTTAEAATASGGNSGRGGEILWRWGSPHAYNQGTLEEQQLFWNHDAQWIDDFVNEDYPYYGQVAVFNNFINFELLDNGRSFGQIISPVWNEEEQSYLMETGRFLPTDFSATFVHPDSLKNYSSMASSIQIMGEGHVIMTVAAQGRTFELNEDGEVVWEYLTPMRNGVAMPQGLNLNLTDNFTFQSSRYPADYSAFEGRDLTPQGYIEVDPNETFCTVVGVSDWISEPSFTVFPNPTNSFLRVKSQEPQRLFSFELYDSRGALVKTFSTVTSTERIDLSGLVAGVYVLRDRSNAAQVKIIIR